MFCYYSKSVSARLCVYTEPHAFENASHQSCTPRFVNIITFVIPPSAIISSTVSAIVRCALCRAYLSSRAHII